MCCDRPGPRAQTRRTPSEKCVRPLVTEHCSSALLKTGLPGQVSRSAARLRAFGLRVCGDETNVCVKCRAGAGNSSPLRKLQCWVAVGGTWKTSQDLSTGGKKL